MRRPWLGGTRCLRLTKLAAREALQAELRALVSARTLEDVEAEYAAARARLEGALELDISSHILRGKKPAALGSAAKVKFTGLTQNLLVDPAV